MSLCILNFVPTKCNFTADKFITLENWMNIFDELNPLLTSEPSTSKHNQKAFDVDNGRLTCKAKWVKISDSSDVGTYIVKILNLSSTNAGKYFLKINVKLGSYLERIVSELEQKNKTVYVKSKSKEPSQSSHNSSKQKKSDHRKISDMLIKIPKENHSSPSTFNDTGGAVSTEVLELSSDDFNHVEEYIPFPLPAPACASSFLDESQPSYKSYSHNDGTNSIHSEYLPTPVKKEKDDAGQYERNVASVPAATYNPERKASEIEMNKIKSEYAPTYVTDKPKNDDAVYKPAKKDTKSSDTVEKWKRRLNKSKELFGSSDEDDDDKVSSSSQKPKRKLDLSPKRETRSSKERSKSKKKKLQDVESRSIADSDISIRNLMNESIEGILETYPEHENYLTVLYETHINQSKRSYRPNDVPDMTALDIVSPEQFTAMIDFLEGKLVRDAEEEHNYSDVIFDLIIPEWALAIYCKKFQWSRPDGLERLRLQSVAMTMTVVRCFSFSIF